MTIYKFCLVLVCGAALGACSDTRRVSDDNALAKAEAATEASLPHGNLLVVFKYSDECDISSRYPGCDWPPRGEKLKHLLDPLFSAILDEMSKMGISVFEETTIFNPQSLTNIWDTNEDFKNVLNSWKELQGGWDHRRPKGKSLLICRTATVPPFDMMAIFSIWSFTDHNYLFSAGVDGELYACPTNRFLASHREAIKSVNLQKLPSGKEYSRESIISLVVAKLAEDTGRRVASALAAFALDMKSGGGNSHFTTNSR